MNADNLLRLVIPVAILVVLLGLDLRRRVSQRRTAHRAALARWFRETPFSVRARLAPEEMAHMSAQQIDEFMRPVDMSEVRRELEELEKTEEFKDLKRDAKLRQRRLGITAPPPPAVEPRPNDAELTDEEREMLAQTDARAVRR